MKQEPKILAWMEAVGIALLLLFVAQKGGDLLPVGPWFPPGPVEPSEASPIPVEGLHVLMIEESSARSRLTPEQVATLTDPEIREYVASKGGQFRLLDQHAEFVDADDPFKAAMKRKGASLPWLIVSNHPKGGQGMKLPENAQKTLEVIKKWGER